MQRIRVRTRLARPRGDHYWGPARWTSLLMNHGTSFDCPDPAHRGTTASFGFMARYR